MRKGMFAKVAVAGLVFFACCAKLEAQSNTFPTSGSVGIGTTSPSAPLDLEGTGGVMLDIGGSGGALSFSGVGVSSPPAGLNYGLFPLTGIGLGLYSIAGGISFWGGSTPTPYMTIINGNVGIGTKTPYSALSVLSSGAASDNEAEGNGFQIL